MVRIKAIRLSKARLWTLALAGLLLLLLVFGGDIEEFIASDSCLDSGGRWLYAEERCYFGTRKDCRQAEGLWHSETQRCNVWPRSKCLADGGLWKAQTLTCEHDPAIICWSSGWVWLDLASV